jgi:hypothetical protein
MKVSFFIKWPYLLEVNKGQKNIGIHKNFISNNVKIGRPIIVEKLYLWLIIPMLGNHWLNLNTYRKKCYNDNHHHIQTKQQASNSHADYGMHAITSPTLD